MIKAVIFDLDGTLIQTEVLKASSYAQAIWQLTNQSVKEDQVMDVFEKYVGLSRAEVVQGLYNEFSAALQDHLDNRDSELVKEQLITKRLSIYREMLNDPSLLSRHFCPYTLGLLHKVHKDKFKAVLATMSHRTEARRITEIMGIYQIFELILTRDDVHKGKPDPEIYLEVKERLQLIPEECLVIEDSVNGIKAGLNAGMRVFAVTNEVTRMSVHNCNLLEAEFIVDDLEVLTSRVFAFLDDQSKD